MSQKAILLVNLGSPESPQAKDVKPYLREFLMDEKVIDKPFLFRYLLIEGIILRTRPQKSAEAYQKIWWNEGSPLIVLSERLQKLVQQNTQLPVGLAMRYGNPSIQSGLEKLKAENPDLKEVFVIPLYPHYAMSSYETVVDKVNAVVKEDFSDLTVSFKDVFYNDAQYLDILANSLKPALEKDYDHILFSYHGIPERHVHKTDPSGSHCLKIEDCCNQNSSAQPFCYRHQVFETTKAIAQRLNLPKEKYSDSFQSRLGRDPWLQPFTDHVIEELPKKGVKKLVVLCPAFVSDCLETLEEIGMEARKEFLKAGGEEFTLVPCINTHESWAKLLAQWGEKALVTR